MTYENVYQYLLAILKTVKETLQRKFNKVTDLQFSLGQSNGLCFFQEI